MDTKGLLQSKAFLGLAVLVLGAVLDRFGYTIADKETTTEALVNLVAIGMQVVGAAVSFWGTVTRKTTIDGIIKFD